MSATTDGELRASTGPAYGSLLLRAGLWLALASVAVPALIVRIAPLQDYPNHYVRIWLLGGGVRRPPLSSMYAVDWGMARTNIGLDLIAQLLGPIAPVWVLAPLFLVAALVLPPLGAMLLHRRLFGSLSVWALAFPIAAWSTTLITGLINYQIGLGLALAAVAADPWLKARLAPWRLLVVRAALAAGLLVIHIFALGFYGVLLAALALGPRLLDLVDRKPLRTAAASLASVALCIALPLLIFGLTAPRLPGGGALGLEWGPWKPGYKLNILTAAITSYDAGVDRLFYLAPAIMVAVGLATRRLRAHQGLLAASAGIFLLALVAPYWAADTAFIDIRLPIMGLLALLAALEPLPANGAPQPLWLARTRELFAVLFLVLSVGRSAWVGEIWVQREADVRSVEAALRSAPAGAAVLPLDHKPSARGRQSAPIGRYPQFGANYFHMYTLSVMERGAFSPGVFAQPGKQPLQVRAPWSEIASPNGDGAIPFRMLNAPPDPAHPFLRDWRNRFDYALVLNCDLADDVGLDPIPEGFTLVSDQGFARLYRIERHPGHGANAGSG
jgi:hypothetical protein